MKAFIPWWGTVKGERLKLTYAARNLKSAASLENAIVDKDQTPLDRLVERYRRANPKMGSNDRRVLSLAVYSFARNRNTILSACPELCPGEGRLLSLALLDQLEREGLNNLPPDQLELRPHLKALDDHRAVQLQIIFNSLNERLSDATDGVISAFTELFGVDGFWLENTCWKSVGEAFAALTELKREQSLQLRVNVKKIPREVAIEHFEGQGHAAKPTGFSPWGVNLNKRINLNADKLYREGAVEVQDEGSQLLALSCLPLKKNSRALDLCAGACGKTLALAAATDASVAFHAYDIDKKRLFRAQERVSRSGTNNVTLIPDEGDLKQGSYDLVLVDAPCSSSGTLRRNPDLTWRIDAAAPRRFHELQWGILRKAAELTKPGGQLIYATCSVFKAENESVVEEFLSTHQDYCAEPFEGPDGFADLPGAEKGMLRLDSTIPGYGGDSFFCARLKKGS